MTDCPFCRIVAGELPCHRLYEDERTVAFLDINPGTRGHLLVIPRAHAADLGEIEDEDVAASARTVKRMANRAREALGAAGVSIYQANGRAAWQTVFHYHVHVLPRYPDDTMVVPWRPGEGAADRLEETAELIRGQGA